MITLLKIDVAFMHTMTVMQIKKSLGKVAETQTAQCLKDNVQEKLPSQQGQKF